MITIFSSDSTVFSTLGLGLLPDAITCKVTEGLNDSYELSMTYPMNGKNYDLIQLNRIITCKPNPNDNVQPFRIYDISRPIKGVVEINAYHISYDMNGYAVRPFKATGIGTVLSKIQNGKTDDGKDVMVTNSPFTFETDITSNDKTFQVENPVNLRSALMDGDGSIVGLFEGEVKFDNYKTYIYKHRGSDNGAVVSYAKNMTDLTHESDASNVYTGVYPYYSSTTTSSDSTETPEFKKAYIVGDKPFQDGWLSYTPGGEAIHPVDDNPIQIATEGDYQDKVYTWNSVSNRYIERVYNQKTTAVQDILTQIGGVSDKLTSITESAKTMIFNKLLGLSSDDTPKNENPTTWLKVDWSGLKQLKIVLVANAEGYFKVGTEDAEWSKEKLSVGDKIYSVNLQEVTNLATLTVWYSEVLPTSSNSTTTTETVTTLVETDPKVLEIKKDDAMNLGYSRILPLDLSSEFDDAPTPEDLKKKAEEYINKNDIGIVKNTTSVSFVNLKNTTEASIMNKKDLVDINLGDDVTVRYLDLGVNEKLRVIKTIYDAIKDKYSEIELGEKPDTLSSSSIQNGDSISELKNDSGYVDQLKVSKIIAETVTADYLTAKNAKLSSAQIDQLEVAKINCPGIIEASQFSIDNLVAKLLTADNANIKNTLTAGNIQVAGDISVNSGTINITGDDGTVFNVDRGGNVVANSVSITGGNLDIGDGSFTVSNDGKMTASNADIIGTISSDSGEIGGFKITNTGLYTNDKNSFDSDNSGIFIGNDGLKIGNNFSVDNKGEVNLTSGNLNFGKDSIGNPALSISNDGTLKVTKGSLKITDGTNNSTEIGSNGKLTCENVNVKTGNIGPLTVNNNYISYPNNNFSDVNFSNGTGCFAVFNDNFYKSDKGSFYRNYSDSERYNTMMLLNNAFANCIRFPIVSYLTYAGFAFGKFSDELDGLYIDNAGQQQLGIVNMDGNVLYDSYSMSSLATINEAKYSIKCLTGNQIVADLNPIYTYANVTKSPRGTGDSYFPPIPESDSEFADRPTHLSLDIFSTIKKIATDGRVEIDFSSMGYVDIIGAVVCPILNASGETLSGTDGSMLCRWNGTKIIIYNDGAPRQASYIIAGTRKSKKSMKRYGNIDMHTYPDETYYKSPYGNDLDIR